MIAIIPIEPINEAHGMLIVEAFNRFFINKGGQQDGYGNGYGRGLSAEPNGNGWGNGIYNDNGTGFKIPEAWRINEISSPAAKIKKC